MKVSTELVSEIIKRHVSEPQLLKDILHDIQAELDAEQSDEEKPPAQKKQFVILVSDPNGVMPDVDLVGWVVQIPEMDSPLTVTDRIHRASYDFNSSRRGRKCPVSTIGEAMEAVPPKHFKEAECFVKTKIPVSVIVTDNQVTNHQNITL